MKLSTLHSKTSKENPKGEMSANAKLLIRAGMVDKVMAGVYTFLPLGLRTLRKIENIVRKHMDEIGNEILLPALSPEENREKTGRKDTVDVLMKTSGANEASKRKSTNEYILNCTHEDVVTPMIQKFAQSYKDFPCAVYQIQSKFRNEARAKNGLLRWREFRMKDLYSFHTSKECFLEYYNKSKEVYTAIFDELGLWGATVIAEASGGDFTELNSHEFQTFLETGEDTLFVDEKGKISYNKEIAPAQAIDPDCGSEEWIVEDVFGEGIVSVEKLSKFLGIPVERTVKTLLYKDENKKYYAVAVRGDYEVNELKLKKILWVKKLEMITEQEIQELTWAERGYAGIINLPEIFTMICDDALENLRNFESGTNKTNYHTININRWRDIKKPKKFYDIKVAKKGDRNPETGSVYVVKKASEVGNIFPLETKFPDAFDYKFIDQDGKSKKIFMGSYGIGISRVMWVIVEKFHDEKGIIRPENIAPFTHVIIGIGDEWSAEAEKLYEAMRAEWKEVALDDRKGSPGSKFKDADLIGYPYQIVIGKKTLAEGRKCELITRKTGEKKLIDIDSLWGK